MGMKPELSPRSGGKGDWSLTTIFEVGKKLQRATLTRSRRECFREIEVQRRITTGVR